MKINGDESTNVHTFNAATTTTTTKSPSQLDEASGDDSPHYKGIRLRTFSTPIQSYPESKLTCDTNSRMNVNHKVLFRRNNSLIPDVVGNFDNISIHSDEWLKQRQSFLRMLSQAKSRKLSPTVDETAAAIADDASSHSSPSPSPPQVVARDNTACEDCTPSQVPNDTSCQLHPSSSSLASSPVEQICPPFFKVTSTTSGHHSSSSEDEEWHANIEWLRQKEGVKKVENIPETRNVNETHELKSYVAATAATAASLSHDPKQSDRVPTTAEPPLATVTQQMSTLACYSADSGGSMADLTSINTSPLKENTTIPGNEQSYETDEPCCSSSSQISPSLPPAPISSQSLDTKHGTSRNSCKKLSNKCPGCMLV